MRLNSVGDILLSMGQKSSTVVQSNVKAGGNLE